MAEAEGNGFLSGIWLETTVLDELKTSGGHQSYHNIILILKGTWISVPNVIAIHSNVKIFHSEP